MLKNQRITACGINFIYANPINIKFTSYYHGVMIPATGTMSIIKMIGSE